MIPVTMRVVQHCHGLSIGSVGHPEGPISLGDSGTARDILIYPNQRPWSQVAILSRCPTGTQWDCPGHPRPAALVPAGHPIPVSHWDTVGLPRTSLTILPRGLGPSWPSHPGVPLEYSGTAWDILIYPTHRPWSRWLSHPSVPLGHSGTAQDIPDHPAQGPWSQLANPSRCPTGTHARDIPDHPAQGPWSHPIPVSHWDTVGLPGTSRTIPPRGLGPSWPSHPGVPLGHSGTARDIPDHPAQGPWSQLAIPSQCPTEIQWDCPGHPSLSHPEAAGHPIPVSHWDTVGLPATFLSIPSHCPTRIQWDHLGHPNLSRPEDLVPAGLPIPVSQW